MFCYHLDIQKKIRGMSGSDRVCIWMRTKEFLAARLVSVFFFTLHPSALI